MEKGPPPAPTGLVATPGETSIKLDWDASTGGDVERYAIDRSVDNGAWTRLSDQLPSPTYTDTDAITMGTTYTYRVYAIDNQDRFSPASAEVTTTPVIPRTQTAPPAPVLSGTYTQTGKSIVITWTQVTDAAPPAGETQSGLAGYRVYRSTSTTFPGDSGQIWTAPAPRAPTTTVTRPRATTPPTTTGSRPTTSPSTSLLRATGSAYRWAPFPRAS